MAYGNDVSVFVEDKAGDLGAPGSSPFWLSPDVDIPAHPGEAVQGSNDVQIRVHSHEEPFIDEKVVAEVYVGNPSLAMSPTVGTVRIDPGNLLFRPPGIAGSEPVLTQAGATLSFPWTPSSTAGAVNGPGHRCLVVRAFPQSLTPPSSPFNVPNEQHEAQRNIVILTTTKVQMDMSSGGGAGTRDDPRGRDKETGLWWQRLDTLARGKRGRRFVVWAFDPSPDDLILDAVRRSLGRRKFGGFSERPPESVSIEPVKETLDPRKLAKSDFGRQTGLGRGLFRSNRLLAAGALVLGPRKLSHVILRFDHSALEPRTAVVLHGAQWSEDGTAEGGITLVALAPETRKR